MNEWIQLLITIIIALILIFGGPLILNILYEIDIRYNLEWYHMILIFVIIFIVGFGIITVFVVWWS